MAPERIVLRELFAALPEAAFAGLHWQPFREGVEIVRLYGDGASGPAAALLRYAKGASVPRHEHGGLEHIVVLTGAQSDERDRYQAGTLLIHGPDTEHGVRSDEGCVVLAIWTAPVRFL